MQLRPDEKKMLEKMGAAGMKHGECAAMLEMDMMAFKDAMRDPDSEIFKAYAKGYLGAKLKLSESISELAFRGSGPSQKMLHDILSASDIEFDI
ncbi:MAG: hypothetical protein JSS76_08495 [Bacteroidetes bacterium]|nr:hypothetical protein [Bacteroidota bacterium]